MSPGDRLPMESSRMGVEGSDGASDFGYGVGSLFFLLGGPGSKVGSTEGISLGYLQGNQGYLGGGISSSFSEL